MREKNLIGIFFILLYCCISALAYVLLNQFEQEFNPFKMAFYSFLITQIFFIFFAFRTRAHIIAISKHNWGLVLKLNIATAFSWMLIFYALKYIDPSVANGVVFSVVPIGAVVWSYIKTHFESPKKEDLFFSIIIGIAALSLIVAYFLSVPNFIPLLIPMICVIGSGFAVVCCIFYLKILSVKGLTNIQIMSTRFFLLILFPFFILLFFGDSFRITGLQLLKIIIIAACTGILPSYLFQKGLEQTTPIISSFITPLQPVMTYLILYISNGLQASFTIFVLIILLCLTILISAFYKSRAAYRRDKDSNGKIF